MYALLSCVLVRPHRKPWQTLSFVSVSGNIHVYSSITYALVSSYLFSGLVLVSGRISGFWSRPGCLVSSWLSDLVLGVWSRLGCLHAYVHLGLCLVSSFLSRLCSPFRCLMASRFDLEALAQVMYKPHIYYPCPRARYHVHTIAVFNAKLCLLPTSPLEYVVRVPSQFGRLVFTETQSGITWPVLMNIESFPRLIVSCNCLPTLCLDVTRGE